MVKSFLDEGLDPYQILNVPHRATAEEIKRSYREKVKYCHPDLGSEAGRVETFKRVTWAYRVLMDAAWENHQQAAASESAGEAPYRLKTATNSASTPPADEKSRIGRSERVAEILAAAQEKLQAGAWRDAEMVGRLAVREDPQDPDAYLMLARALAAQHSYAEAIGCLTLALHLAPNHEAAREALNALRHRSRESDSPGR
jgi:tetratricopeptide (TPR) repeat protein